MDDKQVLAALLFPEVTKTPEEILEKYPRRVRENGEKVTRFAPSPTGFLHIGGLFTAMVNRRVAADGICYLRIEDTDKKREVADGVTGIINGLHRFGIDFDEGMTGPKSETGEYGPYLQSKRKEIYQVFAKSLVEKGFAYPCFCTEEALAEKRSRQEAQKVNPGYYGEWASCRELTLEDIKARLERGEPFVLRLRSPGRPDHKCSFKDAVKGKIEMPENEQDIVLLKRDGIPTYHFAHAVDDTLMGTTHVIRGDEWISSAPVHLQLFYVLGFKPPVYAHVSPIMKEEDTGKRKLSKRKDPEASVEYYRQEGYPAASVIEYLLTIANSNFEDWRKANPKADNRTFPFKLSAMSRSGALFDLKKLNDVSKNVISVMPAKDVFALAAEWAREYDPPLSKLLDRDEAFATAIFDIDRTPVKPRKDIGKWSDVRDYVSYFYDELWDRQRSMPENLSKEDVRAVLSAYLDAYNPAHSKDEWFAAIKDLCEPLGFAREVKEYKKNPDGYKGHVGDVSSVLRIAVTGRKNTPDLYAIMQLLGEEQVRQRLSECL